MKFTLTIPLVPGNMTPRDVALLLELAASQLRADGEFGAPCADGFTTQNIRVPVRQNKLKNNAEPIIAGTYAVKGKPGSNHFERYT